MRQGQQWKRQSSRTQFIAFKRFKCYEKRPTLFGAEKDCFHFDQMEQNGGSGGSENTEDNFFCGSTNYTLERENVFMRNEKMTMNLAYFGFVCNWKYHNVSRFFLSKLGHTRFMLNEKSHLTHSIIFIKF